MSHKKSDGEDTWLAQWLGAVADGTATMSQRQCSTVNQHGGEQALIAAATARGVHIAQLTDDRGNALYVASLHPIRSVC